MSVISDVLKYLRLTPGLRNFLRSTISLEESKQVITTRLRNRGRNFLSLVKEAIYQNPKSPYFKLLQMANCELGDIESLVNKGGIEATLQKLLTEGVYLSWEEFKGMKEVVRGSNHFQFKERDFNNPFLVGYPEGSTGASRSAGTKVTMNLGHHYYHVAHKMAAFDAHGILGSPILVWQPILPSIAGITLVLWAIKMGNPPVRWFSPVEARMIKPSLSKRLATYYIVYAGRLFGATFPKPEYANLEQAYKIADCIAEILKRGQDCVIFTPPSSAVRVCQISGQKRLDLTGATFHLGGEPLTAAKLKEIRAAGAKALNVYAAADMTISSHGCAGRMAASDDIHLTKDLHAVIQRWRETPLGGASVNAFLFTSLLHNAPKILLNVESGDYGVIENRQCGCKLGELGLTDHIYNIRSFDKLTGEGMSFVGIDILRIIEEVLPAKFGGASIDYQMVEEEDETGRTCLNVLVSPEVGEINEDELAGTIVSELSKGKDTQRMMAEIWSQARMLRVKRERPLVTTAGKLLPLHIQKGKT